MNRLESNGEKDGRENSGKRKQEQHPSSSRGVPPSLDRKERLLLIASTLSYAMENLRVSGFGPDRLLNPRLLLKGETQFASADGCVAEGTTVDQVKPPLPSWA